MLAFATALGECGLDWGPAGITRVVLPGDRALIGARRGVAGMAPPPVRDAVDAIVALLAGEPRDLRAITIDTARVAPFASRVYAATREIGPGVVSTYGEIARAIADPTVARAVGAALGANPYPIIVPCHRVLAADGALHGFSAPGGTATKRRMLEIEGAPGFAQETLFA